MITRLFWLLAFAAFVIPAGWSAEAPATPPAPTAKRIGIDEFEKLRTQTNTVTLDVRSKAEFAKGHIPGAVNIDINSGGFTEAIAVLDKKKTYLVHCAVGMRSAKACKQMETMGFKELYDLAPGFDGWKKAGKLVEK